MVYRRNKSFFQPKRDQTAEREIKEHRESIHQNKKIPEVTQESNGNGDKVNQSERKMPKISD